MCGALPQHPASHAACPTRKHRMLCSKKTALFSKTICQRELSCKRNHLISPLGGMSSSNRMSPMEPSNLHSNSGCWMLSSFQSQCPALLQGGGGRQQEMRSTYGRWGHVLLWRNLKFGCVLVSRKQLWLCTGLCSKFSHTWMSLGCLSQEMDPCFIWDLMLCLTQLTFPDSPD